MLSCRQKCNATFLLLLFAEQICEYCKYYICIFISLYSTRNFDTPSPHLFTDGHIPSTYSVGVMLHLNKGVSLHILTGCCSCDKRFYRAAWNAVAV